MKYVVFQDTAGQKIGTDAWPKGGQIIESSGAEQVLVFPDGITHSVMTEQLQKIYPGLEPIAAGFCSFSEDGWYCEGKSVSLQLASRGQIDANLIHESLWVDL